MTSRQVKDPALRKVVLHEVDSSVRERMLFIDNDNQIREAVYPPAFGTGDAQLVRERLIGFGVLKAVLHVSALVESGRSGVRMSVLEYLPDNIFYGIKRQLSPAWVLKEDEDGLYSQAVQNTLKVYGQEGEEEDNREA